MRSRMPEPSARTGESPFLREGLDLSCLDGTTVAGHLVSRGTLEATDHDQDTLSVALMGKKWSNVSQ